MKRLIILAALMLAAGPFANPSFASSFSFTGAFIVDDDVRLFQFVTDGIDPVVILSLGFAGGTNAAAGVIPAGGFPTVLSLFDSTGFLLSSDIGSSHAAPGCGLSGIDPMSGFCWDAALQLTLTAGTYTVALTQDGNTPAGIFLADGFSASGTGDYTGPMYLGAPGAFILVSGEQRTANWALDISGAESAAVMASVPEPGSALLLLSGAGLLLAARGAGQVRTGNATRTESGAD